MKKICKVISFILFIVLILSCFSGCGEEKYYTNSFFAMDTIIELKLIKSSEDTFDSEAVFDTCENMLGEIEASLSKTIETSDAYILNTDIDIMVDVKDMFGQVMSRSLEISKATGGAFDVSVGTLVSLWSRCADENRMPSENEIYDALNFVGEGKIDVDGKNIIKAFRETKVDLGAIGKGYAAQKITEYLKNVGVTGGILSFGGNISVFGKKSNGEKFKVGIRNPKERASAVGYVLLDEGFVSVSGEGERYFEIGGKKYTHIIDPQTGYPVSNGLYSVAVICDDGALADALSTALYVMGREAAVEFYNSRAYDFEAVFISEDGVFVTRGLEEAYEAEKNGEFKDFAYCG